MSSTSRRKPEITRESSCSILLTKYHQDNQIKADEMRGGSIMCGQEQAYVEDFGGENEEKNHTKT